MTVAESRSVAPPHRTGEFLVVDTTELRWFVPGALPADVGAWFTATTGVREERCDVYLLGDRTEIGTKRRYRETMELKVRQSSGEAIDLGGGLAGTPEVWRKWTPAEGLVDDGGGRRWVEVHKTIVKRRFAADGREVAFTGEASVSWIGCDVEVAAVTVGTARWWTFAFAAYGPPARRRAAIRTAWRAVRAGEPCPASFDVDGAFAMGYPEWLTRTV